MFSPHPKPLAEPQDGARLKKTKGPSTSKPNEKEVKWIIESLNPNECGWNCSTTNDTCSEALERSGSITPALADEPPLYQGAPPATHSGCMLGHNKSNASSLFSKFRSKLVMYMETAVYIIYQL